ncbi:MAG: reverse transcriptase domain-containing protein [Candidatus Aenigmatarchaeota archaeon]
MKTYGNLYGKVCSFENLLLAFRKARKGKSDKWYVKRFEADLDNELLRLKRELEEQAYEPRPLKRFIIRDPKTRVIHASHFRDRVVHHALCNVLEPIFDRTFIYDSYANRKGKGGLAAQDRFDEFKRKASQNGRLVRGAKDDNMVVGYVLKADIRHYFPSVNHEILTGIIGRKIRDENILWLIGRILSNNDPALPKGMPIGNQTSQFFANVYLNELDYFVKHVLKARFYLRYVDDFVILDRSEAKLMLFRSEINGFLKHALKLELHEEKSQVYPLHKGISLLGFRMFYHYRVPKRRNLLKLEKRMLKLKRLYESGEVSAEEVAKCLEGWLAYAKQGDTFKLRKTLVEKYGNMFSITFS